MLSLGQTFLYALLGLVGLLLWKLYPFVIRSFTNRLRNLPGPPSASLLYGNLKEIDREDNSVPQERWAEQYGPVLTYKGFLGMERLWTLDTRAVNHILTHSMEYQKPSMVRVDIARIIGSGLVFAEGEQHRQQRRVMNPAFGISQIRELTEIFVDKAIELRDGWGAEMAKGNEPVKIDVLKSLSKTTLEVIGLAGFNYRFDSPNPQGKPNELVEAFGEIFNPSMNMSPLMLLKAFIPFLRVIPDSRSRRLDYAQGVMRRIGMRLIAEKRAAIMREAAEGKSKDTEVEHKDLRGRDLLTLLLKSNMASDIPDSQKLSDEDVIAQVPTFLVAGHETTSVGTTWCLFALTQAPEVQAKLREELFTIATDTPTMDELNSLPYLDAVVREMLRLHAPVPVMVRVATADDVIPVSEPFVDRHGKVQDSISISKGSYIFIPILSLNRSKKLWGEDAHQFKPERWENPPQEISNIPGVWGHLLSFGGGPRACIGYRFSLVEMKALIFTLVRAFEFELAVPPEEIQKKTAIVQRPILRSAPQDGSQMPLLVKRYQRVV